MRLRVLHETHYAYSAPIHALAMEARLQPCNDDYQFCQRYRLSVTPKTPIETYTPFNDMTVHYWTLLKATEVSVISESIVDIRERPLLPLDAPPFDLDPIHFYQFLNTTPLTTTTGLVEEFAAQFRQTAAEDWYQTVIDVQRAVNQLVNYSAGCTGTNTTASEVLTLGCGVCQDFTHLMLASLRHLGIPARYVSGYLNQDYSRQTQQLGGMVQHMTENGMSQTIGGLQNDSMTQESSLRLLTDSENSLDGIAIRGSGASHAWVEVYFGESVGWRGFDPTNNLLVNENFVRVGSGRDFNDVTPVKGVHKGPAEEELTITVSVTRHP
jgi:transglutaminase-like putative cysteine protease